MLLIKNPNTNPYFNLAAEEYFLKTRTEDIFIVWRNFDAVILGRNQDAEREVDSEAVKTLGVKVVRRLTGGGAVYHDKGNVNFTFIRRNAEAYFNDYPYFAAPITSFLKTVGVDAEFSGRNDILAGGAKISGTAQVKHNSDVLFHGTLLIDTDLGILGKVLKPDYEKLERHAIKSVQSRVTNLKDIMSKPYTATEVMDLLFAHFLSNDGAENYDMTGADVAAIEELAGTKYSTYEWNYFGNI